MLYKLGDFLSSGLITSLKITLKKPVRKTFREELTRSLIKERVKSDLKRLKNRLQFLWHKEDISEIVYNTYYQWVPLFLILLVRTHSFFLLNWDFVFSFIEPKSK